MKDTHQVSGNFLTLLEGGAEYFPQLCADIDAAQQSIYLETYIFAADQTGRVVTDALQRAAKRGVVVRVLLDGYGSAELPQSWVDDLRMAEVKVRCFQSDISPFTFQRNVKRRLRRMHRKMVAIDGKTAYVGGINVVNDVPPISGFAIPQLDFAVRVQGSVAANIHLAMQHLWNVVSWANFRRRGKRIRLPHAANQPPVVDPDIALVVRDNVRHRRDIEKFYLKAIYGAKSEIVIANAYFLPGRKFRKALIEAALRGVRVVLLLQGRVEFWVQHYATHALYEELLAAGIEIYEYQSSFLHAKVAVMDGLWTTVGSSNIDPFSLLLAREGNVVVRHAGFSNQLRDRLFSIIEKDASRVGPSRGDYLTSILSRISYGVIRFLVGIVVFARWP
ncbi:MAG: cardiolipin synthase ClsB [Sterolibacteriaceae bacterium]|nr:cardiolipin synthase ClsB [Sterolibacteriaceae bacterium]